MFFILSKVLTYLILPVSLLALLLLISLLSPKGKVKRGSFILFCILFFLFTNPFVANQLITWWEVPATSIQELESSYDAAIILTGVTDIDKEPQDRVHLNKGADRIMHTVQLYKLGKVPLIIVSGGSGKIISKNEPSEAEQIKKVLLVSGVPEQHILLETRSRNTYENARFTTQLLEDKELSKDNLLMVTSAFHMRRALACFLHAGISPQPYSTDFYSFDPKFTPEGLLIPTDEAIIVWKKLISEWVGYLIYDVVGYL